jgi:hypothetical protein
LLSEHWLNLRLDSVLDFLGSGSAKNVVEEQLAASVVEWGKFQVEADGGDPQNGPSLRAKILPAINLIKFTEVPPKNFAKLCQRELGSALSVSEKLAIFKSMSGNIRELQEQRTSGRLRIIFEKCESWVIARDGAEYSAHLTFKIYKQAKVFEPNLITSNGWQMARCELRDSDGNVVIESGSFNDSVYILASGTNYTFVMNFSCQLNVDEEERYFQTHQVPANTNFCLCGFCLTVVSCSKFFGDCGFDVRLQEAFKYP